MQSLTNQNAAAQQIDVLLFDEFSGLCLANTIEPMRAANRLSGRDLFSWRFLTLDGGAVTSSSGMQISADDAVSRCSGDMLIVMASYNYRQMATPHLGRGLRAAAARYGALAGFDTGSWLLASAGLLENRSATIHWQEIDEFAEAFPDIGVVRERFTIDGNRITCAGALAAFDLLLDLIGQRFGQILRLEVSSLFMSAEATGTAAAQGLAAAGGRHVSKAISLMQANLEHPLSIATIAPETGKSQRWLETRIHERFGATPQAIYRRLRLIHARKWLMESDFPIGEIALRCGYQDASAMSRAFKSEFGLSPRDLRRAS